MRTAITLLFALLALPAVAQQTITKPGTAAPNAAAVQGVTGMIPLQVQGVAGATSDVELHDHATPGNHLAIDAAGKLGVNNFPASFDVTDRIARLVGHVICDSGCSGGANDLALTSAADETLTTRAAVTAALRLRDTSLGAGAQLIGWRGDTTSGAWVNVKNSSLAVTGTFWQTTQPVSGTFWQATQPVSATSLPLPANAAQETSGNLATLVARTPALGAATTANSTPVNIASDQTVPVAAASLPLPAGAATGAKQDTGNTSLSSIDAKTPALISGRVPVDGSGVTQPVSGTFWQATQPISIATMPSTPVTGTFWQTTQPVSAASLPLPSGAATDAALAETHGIALNPAPAKMDVIGGVDPLGRNQQIALASGGVIYVQALPAQPINPFLPRCNPVRRTNCQP